MTERWTNPDGWSIDLPIGWTHDVAHLDDGEGTGVREGFVPPSAVGRLSVMGTLVRRDSQPMSDDEVLRIARKFARSLGFAFRDEPILRLRPRHRAVEMRGTTRGRHCVAIVHVMDAIAVMIYWHTPDGRDPDSPAGVATARSVRPSRPG